MYIEKKDRPWSPILVAVGFIILMAANVIDAKAASIAGAQSGANAGAAAGANSNANSQSGALSGSASGAVSSQQLGIDQRNYATTVFPAKTEATVTSAPTVYAPSLTTSGDGTCSGSASGSASWLGAGGSAATTYQVEECVRRLNATTVAAVLGDVEIAREIMCGSPMVYEAYKFSDRPCKLKPSIALPLVPGGYVVSQRTMVERPSPVLKVANKPVQPVAAVVESTVSPTAADTERRLKAMEVRKNSGGF